MWEVIFLKTGQNSGSEIIYYVVCSSRGAFIEFSWAEFVRDQIEALARCRAETGRSPIACSLPTQALTCLCDCRACAIVMRAACRGLRQEACSRAAGSDRGDAPRGTRQLAPFLLCPLVPCLHPQGSTLPPYHQGVSTSCYNYTGMERNCFCFHF